MHTLEGLALFTLQNCDNITYDSIHFAFVTSLKSHSHLAMAPSPLGDLTYYFNSCIAFNSIDVPQFPPLIGIFVFNFFFNFFAFQTMLP